MSSRTGHKCQCYKIDTGLKSPILQIPVQDLQTDKRGNQNNSTLSIIFMSLTKIRNAQTFYRTAGKYEILQLSAG